MMKVKQIGQTVKYSQFENRSKKNREFFVVFSSSKNLGFPETLVQLHKDYLLFLKKIGLKKDNLMFARFFLSDIANQSGPLAVSKIMKQLNGQPVSVIGQCPLDGSKAIMLAHFLENKPKNYNLLYRSNMTDSEVFDSAKQTSNIFETYKKELSDKSCNLLQNCVRTWIYVRDIDNHYGGMVKARREFFAQNGLTPESRFIASTGIEGKPVVPGAIVSFDAISIEKLRPEQIVRMEALTHLNPTHHYGVTFERGAKVEFGDRAHLYISGTASINNKGEVLHIGDPKKQTLRILENIKALLSPHKASLKDMAYMIVYVRNITDIKSVSQVLKSKKLDKIPTIFVEGAVCRPTWLVEIEGEALIENSAQFPEFV